MRNWGSIIVILVCTAASPLATAQTVLPTTEPAAPSVASAPSASAKRLLADRVLAGAMALQIALEREGFSPGIIDGKIGPKARAATECYQRFNGLPATGVLDTPTEEQLQPDPERAVMEYTVQSDDLEGIHPLLDDWNERAKLTYMGYYDPLDSLAEKFHTTKAMVRSLNPGVAFDSIQPGTVLIVPAVQDAKAPKAASLKIDLGRKQILALDEQGKVVSLFHCSIAASVEKRPSGQTRVITVNRNPDYTFDPKNWPEVHNVTRRLIISSGPRNPVGLAWIGLDLPGYGIHGTPHPEMIGKTGSHGCFRMANWDAVRLSRMIRAGATVTFVAQ